MIVINSNFIFIFTKFFVIIIFFQAKLLILGILFSTAVGPVVKAKLLILGFLFLTSFILTLIAVLVLS